MDREEVKRRIKDMDERSAIFKKIERLAKEKNITFSRAASILGKRGAAVKKRKAREMAEKAGQLALCCPTCGKRIDDLK